MIPDIDKLEGRELDSLVAEKVCGWRNVEHGGEFRGTAPWPGYFVQVGAGFCPVPQYSADPAAMMLVVERMAELGFEFSLYRGVEGDCEAEFMGEDTCSFVRADSAPLAVCRAALKAVGEGKE